VNIGFSKWVIVRLPVVFLGGGFIFDQFSIELTNQHLSIGQFAFLGAVYLIAWSAVRVVAIKLHCRNLTLELASVFSPYVALLLTGVGVWLIPMAVRYCWVLMAGALIVDVLSDGIMRCARFLVPRFWFHE